MSRQQLLSSARRFCDAFRKKEDINIIVGFFSDAREVFVTEYGEPALAPFLGRRFTGATGIREYFEIVNTFLTYENIEFSDFVVDEETRKVALKGKGTFQWRSTEEKWNEAFAYMLSFDEEGRIIGYQVWADTGSAYLARIGKLDDVRAGKPI